MYAGETVTIAITNAYSFESYSLDWSSGSLSQKPDVASSAFSALQPSLKNLDLWNANLMTFQTKHFNAAAPPPAVTCTSDAVNTALQNSKDAAAHPELPPKQPMWNDIFASQVISACFSKMATLQDEASQFYAQIQVAIWPDSITVNGPQAASDIGESPNGASDDDPWERAMVCEVYGGDTAADGSVPLIGNVAQELKKKDRTPEDCSEESSNFYNLYNDLFVTSSAISTINTAINPAGGAPTTSDQTILTDVQLLMDSKANLDSTRTDVSGYGTRLVSLVARPPTQATTIGQIPPPSAQPTQIPSVVYNANALNLILTPQSTTDNTKKKQVIQITVVYGDARWEVSAGTFFSSLPVRSFVANPVFTAGTNEAPDAVTDKKVAENVLRPLVIPFAAINYRLPMI